MIYLLRTSCCGSEQLPVYCWTLGFSSVGLLCFEYDDDVTFIYRLYYDEAHSSRGNGREKNSKPLKSNNNIDFEPLDGDLDKPVRDQKVAN